MQIIDFNQEYINPGQLQIVAAASLSWAGFD